MDNKLDNELTLVNDIEKELTDINGLLFINSGVLVSNESYHITNFVKDIKTIGIKLYKVSIKLYKFSKAIRDFAVNKIVSEKKIHENFNMLADAVGDIHMTRAYVEDVPTFQEQRARFLGLMRIVDYIEKSAGMSVNSMPTGDTYIENIAKLSNGVLTISKPDEGSTFKNLTWKAPNLVEYDLKGSPWANVRNLDQIKNISIKCKYDMVDKLQLAANKIAKRCDEARDEYSNSLGGYDDQNNTGEYERIQYEMAALYSLSYSIEKAIQQTMSEGLRKEVNTFTNKYLVRLKKYEYR